MITFQSELLLDFYKDAAKQLSEHWDEVGTLKSARDYRPDVATYLEIEKRGRIICVTARDGADLVGYAVGIVGPDLHAAGQNICITDIYRVAPHVREQGIGQMLFDYYASVARKYGCATMTNRQKLDADGKPIASDEFFKRLGYQKTEIVWIRSLK